jgi:bifunctional UDP-N-acetylglucosamine pyrophosphorylase/glucosamine-1-phosphate N-acetyltransferase
MIGVLLAAGAGRKFWPFSDVRNKCAFPVGNEPMVRRLAQQLFDAGCGRLVVVVGVHPGSVKAALQGLDDRVSYVRQPQPEGSAAALALALELTGDVPLVVAAGDLVTTAETVAKVVGAAREGSAPAVILVEPLAGLRAGDWITTQVSAGSASGFQGHGRGGSHRVCGLYALQPAALPYVRSNPGLMTHVPVGGMPACEAELGESLARMMDDALPVQALETTGFFVDVDKPWHALEANRRLLEHLSERLTGSAVAEGGKIAESAEIHGRVVLAPGAAIGERVVVRGDLWLGPGASVTNGAIIEGRCTVGAGARVRDYAQVGSGSTLGPGALCGHGAEFSGTLLEGAYLYHYCEIYGLLGAKVDIGAATVCGTLRFDDAATIHRVNGRAEIPAEGANASYLGDYSRTGVNAILMPGVKVGAYSCVGAGVVLYEDLPSQELVLVKQELIRRPWGPERYGW